MKLKFTKMQGAGNDFVVLDETQTRLNLTPAHYRFLGNRHFGIGADQILTVLPSPAPGIDFEYKIHNADGGEVEQCGNGARCFLSFVRTRGLTQKTTVRVKTMERVIELQSQPDGQVTVDMGAPVFKLSEIPFVPGGLPPPNDLDWQPWQLALEGRARDRADTAIVTVAVASMGNPHAVMLVEDVDAADVGAVGPRVQRSSAFPEGVNVGFMQILGRGFIRLRVFERGVGETLACGTGACAAVVCGIRLGLLDNTVDVQTRGGKLSIHWGGGTENPSVMMTGPATHVFDGEINLPETFPDTLSAPL